MTGCCVPSCTNSTRKGFKMRSFPRDPVRRKKWADNIGRKNWIPQDSSKLCEAHFADSMWEKVRVDGKRRLKCIAEPTLFGNKKLLLAEEVTPNLVRAQPADEQMAVDVKEEPEEEFDETLWAKPHFYSLQGYLEDQSCLTKICRICLQAIENDTWQILTTDATNFQTDIQNKVKFILPNMDLDVFSNSLVCNKCMELVNYSIELQEKWLLSQNRLNEIIDKTKTEKTKVNDILIMVEPPTMEIKEESAFYQIDISTPSSTADEPTILHQNVTNENLLSPHETEIQPEILKFNKASIFETSVATTDKQKEIEEASYINIICSVCNNVFTSIAKYAIHTARHKETKNTCFRCKKELYNVSELFYHLRRCLKTNNEYEINPGLHEKKATSYKCQICKQEFLFAWYLWRHRQLCTR